MNKPTGKLAMAYQTIAKMENKIANLVAANEAALEQLASVSAGRDALVAQFEQLRKLGLIVVRQCSKADRYTAEVEDLDDAINLSDGNQFLVEVKEQAGKDGYLQGWRDAEDAESRGMVYYDISGQNKSKEYANKIRQQGKPVGTWLKDSNAKECE